MSSLLDLIKALFGPKAISSTLGTRTNVVRFPGGKLDRYLKESLNIEAASDSAALNVYRDMEQLVPYVSKMNDSERLIFEGNLGRLRNKLEAADLLPKQKVTKEGEVVGMESKEKITGEELKKLTEEKGTVNPPTTVSGQLELSAKKLEDLKKKVEDEFAAGKKRKTAGELLDEYFSSYSSMKQVEDTALVRAVAREIMYQDLKAGKLKVPQDVSDVIRGIGPANRDVLDEFSQWYGVSAIEDLYDNADRFYRMADPKEAVDFLKKNETSNWIQVFQPREKPIKDYMTPEEFREMLKDATVNKYGVITPKGSESLDKETAKEIYDFYLKSGDRNLILKEINEISEGKKFDVYKVEDRNRIIDILSDVLKKLGPPVATGAVGLDYLAEKSAPPQLEGGTQQSLGLDYLTGMEPPKEGYVSGGRVGFEGGTIPRLLKFLIEKLSTEKLIDKALLERASPKAVQDLYISKYGKLPSAEEIKEMVNKELQGKSSMETVSPKTGEVTTPKEPVTTAEKVKSYDQDMAKAADEIFPDYDDPKIAADQIAESYAQIKLGKNYDDLTSKQQNKIYSQAYDYVMNRKRGMAKEMNLEQEMNMILNQYDKSMFIKNEQGMVDVTNPENVRKMALLLKRDHPEFYKRLEGEVQTNVLEDFDVTGRKPNATGGRIGYSDGSSDAPSITLDSHEKAPGNMDKYPVKVGNLELGIMGAMSSGKSTPDPYVKINTADRNFTVRGKYNVPDTGISLLGDVGDIRSRSRTDIDVPQYNYKESIRDVMRLNPYSVGIEYAPDQNRNINLRYDDRGNVSLRGEYKFAKGGLGYLMGE